MRFFAILLLFALVVAGSVFLAQTELREDVEKELVRKSREVLAEAGFPEVKVSFDHLHATLGGTVDRPEDKAAALEALKSRVPTGIWPAAEDLKIAIRPTLPPRLRVIGGEGSDPVKIEGVISAEEESSRAMLGARLHALPDVGGIDNSIELDPMVMPFPKMAEFASLASGLLAHPGEVELLLKESHLTVRGTVPNEGLKQGLIELAQQIEAESLKDLIAVEAPVSFTRVSELKITRNRFGLVLSGVYPSEEDRASLLALFRRSVPAAETVDRVEVSATCGPAPWQGELEKVVPVILERLGGEMTVEFGASQIRLTGEVADAAAREAVLAPFASLEKGEPAFELVANLTIAEALANSKVELKAVYAGDLLVLSGRLPESDFPSGLKAKLETVLPELSVKNEIEALAATPGDAWTAGLTEFFAEALPRLSTGEFSLAEGVLKLSGRTLAVPDRQIIQNLAVNTLPTSFTIENQLLHADQPFPKPALRPEQRTKLAETLKSFPVYFEKSSEILREEEKAKVASIAAAVEETGGEIDLIVTGFSDSVGDSESNKALSLRRAASVQAELIRLGISESSLSLESVEEDVSGIPRSQQWKSRRVEVSSAEPAPAAATTF